MRKITIIDALVKLLPDTEWKIDASDLDTLEILSVSSQQTPTQAEIDATIEQIKADEAQAELDRIAKKAAAEAKLVALGLTADDLKALGL